MVKSLHLQRATNTNKYPIQTEVAQALLKIDCQRNNAVSEYFLCSTHQAYLSLNIPFNVENKELQNQYDTFVIIFVWF